jgi:hypothetical protein
VRTSRYGLQASNSADAPRIEKPVKAKTIGRMQQKLAKIAAKTDHAANSDDGPFDGLDSP